MARVRVLVAAGTAPVVAGAMAVLLLPGDASRHVRAGGSGGITSTATLAPSQTVTASPSPAPYPSPTPSSSPAPAMWSGPGLACGSLPLSFASSPRPGTPLAATASLASVTARLTGKVAEPLADPALSSAVLTITESGATVLSARVVPPKSVAGETMTNIIPWDIGPTTATAFEYSPGTGSLCVAHFAGEALPTVMVGLDTGGAHCCTVVRAWPLVPGGVLPAVEDDLGNPGASLQADGDHAILISADNAFAYPFSGFAGSGMPVLVLGFASGAFVDITREHLDLVQADAARFWKAVTDYPDHDGTVALGLLAPWVADECLLGQETQAWATVDSFMAAGKLGGPSPAGAALPSGQAYVTALRTFLRQHGYCS